MNFRITNSFAVLFVTLALTLAAAFAAKAEGDPAPFSGNIAVEKYHKNYEVNPDGSYVLTCDLIYSVLTEEGAKAANHAGLSYSTSLDETEILSAYTLKKDGRRVDVPAANIQEREAVAGGGPMFSDIKTKTIIFPEVAVGDKVIYSYKFNRKTPLFPGHFAFAEVFSRFFVYNDAETRISIPVNSLDLHIFDDGVKGGKVEEKDGRAQWIWTYQNDKIAKPEPESVAGLDYGPRILVSSFKDYGSVASAYEERARPKAKVTDKIKALVPELTAGVDAEREKAKILCTWVAKNVRFAGNYMGAGSVVPHESEEVLANRLGDCKDHVVLLQAMLEAAGIESCPVLVNAGSSYKLPEVACPSVLDHVIAYIPSLDLYFDPTSEFFTFGQLPPNVRGKSVVCTHGNDVIRKTPQCDFKDDTSTMKEALHFHEDGSAEGEVDMKETGCAAALIRSSIAAIQPNMEDLLVRHVLERNGYTGTGKLTKPDPLEPTEEYAYGVNFQITGALNLPGPGALSIKPVFPSLGQVSGNLSGLNLPDRTVDYVCSGNISTEEFTFSFPKNVKIISVPKDAHLNDGRVSYDAIYHLEGNTVTVSRRFEDRNIGPVCTPDDDRKYRGMGREVLKDLNKQIVYQAAEDE